MNVCRDAACRVPCRAQTRRGKPGQAPVSTVALSHERNTRASSCEPRASSNRRSGRINTRALAGCEKTLVLTLFLKGRGFSRAVSPSKSSAPLESVCELVFEQPGGTEYRRTPPRRGDRAEPTASAVGKVQITI